MIRNRHLTFWVLFALATAIGLLLFSYHYLDDLARGMHGRMLQPFIEEMTGSYSAVALIPGVVWLARRVPLCRENWLRLIAAHIAGVVVYTSAHTTLMALSRAILFPLFGLGHYDYGNMIFRYPMEASNDAIWYAIFVSTAYLFERLGRARDLEVHAAQLSTQLAQAQLENLKLQLHPHFLFNTLNAISSVMYEDVRKADTMLARLSEFLRHVLDSSGANLVSLDEELNVERMYVEIMKARLESGLQLSVTVDPDASDLRLPFMLLQPLLENSIKHGLDADRNALDLEIAVLRVGDAAEIHVNDNGVGVNGSVREGAMGLSNVRALLLHTYGESANVSIGERSEGGTRVVLHFPFDPTMETTR